MLRIKDKSEISMNAIMLCMISQCNEEAEKLWTTESNMIDICKKHYEQLQNEAFLT